ncbi:MAG: tRNA (N6-isopentenyl adenosine(37)-C2)-methylthiotransferase MiaB [Bacteroidetes bacterium]|nr:tRNA (N6-isopentenyl adenosine(37)-C2)-methylthiotransferase MiaB [Bacteroidota bacterium]
MGNFHGTLVKDMDESAQGEALSKQIIKDKPVLKHFYIESYGCAMNFSDSEIVASILGDNGFGVTSDYLEADLILLNTCSIREKAEETIRKRLRAFSLVKDQNPNVLVGVLGCMAERLKSKLLEQEKLVDLVVGPDAYRNLPDLIQEAEGGQKAVNVLLSREETYADISPVRLNKNGVAAFISIMRGCNNMCSFCVVPFTRGRERSRDAVTIVNEAQALFDQGYREVTLLGQNVDSYKYRKDGDEETVNFARLLELVALVDPDLRIRFSTSHPKDITDDVLHAMAKYNNICKYIHLPVQSGSSAVLERMNRTYDREWYLERVEAIRKIVPGCSLSSDIITGFCGETEEDHLETLSMIDLVGYDMSYMFFYSERPGTLAARKYKDDIPLEVKKRRLQEVIKLQRAHSLKNNLEDIGKVHRVLIESRSKKSADEFCGRNDQNKMLVFPKEKFEPGQYVDVLVESCTGGTLIGHVVQKGE